MLESAFQEPKGDPSEVPMPYTFRSADGWRKYFEQLPVRLQAEQTWQLGYNFLYSPLIMKAVFSLEVKKERNGFTA